MKRFRTVRFFRRSTELGATDAQEPTILEFGDPITLKLTREIEDRRRRLKLGDSHPAGL